MRAKDPENNKRGREVTKEKEKLKRVKGKGEEGKELAVSGVGGKMEEQKGWGGEEKEEVGEGREEGDRDPEPVSEAIETTLVFVSYTLCKHVLEMKRNS